MNAIWSRQAKYDCWRQVEIAICEGWAEVGVIPADDIKQIREKSAFTLERCDELELETRHDLVAFVRCLEENVGPSGRWIHYGVTSYDVIDTSLGMMLTRSCDVLLESCSKLAETISKLAETHIDTPQIGRTHGIHAEPITFGFKCANWLAELQRNMVRLRDSREELRHGKVSGAVGIHAVVDPRLEELILKKLGLRAEPASTQIINRDKHAHFLNVVALLGAGLERIATELRNLQRTEILEVQEAFAAGQTGSSAMPHKRNPWNSETVCGLSRILRANAHAMQESVTTWHERDLTSSSLERIVFPDSMQLADFMLNRMNRILSGLVVMPETMLKNLSKMGDLVFSEHLMVSLVGKGLPRAHAYKIAQRNAALAWEGADFQQSVRQDNDVINNLSSEELDHVFSLEHHLRNAAFTLSAVKNTS
jgi:adenylosuccinate lyase